MTAAAARPIVIANRLSERDLLIKLDLLELIRDLVGDTDHAPHDRESGACVFCNDYAGSNSHHADCPWVLARWVVLHVAEPRRHQDEEVPSE